ncbi:MAG: hypothetical protein ABIG03_06260 [Candidatus Eisenbacteria bacterium]
MMGLRRPALAAVVVATGLLLPAVAVGQAPTLSPSVDASIDPPSATVGDRLTLRVTLETPEGTRVEFPDVPSMIAPLVVLSGASMPSREVEGATVEDRYYVVAAFETGAVGVPQLAFPYVTVEGESGVVWTDSLTVVVESVMPDTLAEEETGPRDIKPPVELPRRVWPFVVAAAAVLAALVGFHYLRRWWVARRSEPREETPAEPVVPKRAAHLVALERLDALERDDPVGRGDLVGFYVRVTEVVRLYVRDRFAVDAIDMTTTELAPAMTAARIEDAETDWAVRFLARADLAKFARLTPTPERAAEDLGEARAFVERTRFLGDDTGDADERGDGDEREDAPGDDGEPASARENEPVDDAQEAHEPEREAEP